jgi:lipopolysaccharide export system protein LptA
MAIGTASVPYSFTGGTDALAAEVNSNFSALVSKANELIADSNAAVATKTANVIVRRDASGAAELDVTGNVTGNVTGSSGSCTGNAATATVSDACNGPVATASTETIVSHGKIVASTDVTARPTFDFGSNGDQSNLYTIADDAFIDLGVNPGVVIVQAYGGSNLVGMFLLCQTYTVLIAAANAAALWAAGNVDTKICVYWTGTTHVLLNRAGASLQFYVTYMRTLGA